MSDVAIFSIGSILFMFLTWATVMFLYLRFNEVYRRDEAAAPGAVIIEEGNVELLKSPRSASDNP